MDTPFDLLEYLVHVLEELQIPYAIGGSIASSRYGEPRGTRDADVVAALRLGDLPAFLARFAHPEYYVDATVARQAVLERTQFNIIHASSGWKLDIYLPGDWLASQQLAGARRMETLDGVAANFSAPEALIVRKMKFYAETGSEKHLRDIGSMLTVSGAIIDRDRVEALARREGVPHIWQAVLERRRMEENQG